MSKLQGRGKEPTQLTKQNLYLNAGGRCQFPGCNKHLLRDEICWKYINNGEVAHIIASSEI